MGRLTFRNSDAEYLGDLAHRAQSCEPINVIDQHDKAALDAVVERLAAYEDTGFSPEEIAVLRAKLDAAVKDARDNAHDQCRICARYQAKRRCELDDDPNGKDCGGFWRWVWRGLEEQNERT